MKKTILFFCFISLVFTSSAVASNTVPKPIPVLDTIIGYFQFEQLLTEPYNEWYEPEYNAYVADTATLNLLESEKLKTITITVVIGTWCGDSKRETPRFVKIMEYLNFAQENIVAIGVNRQKKAPGTEVEELNIEYVPTFIFFRDNQEIGRIIETPKESLEKDMLKIISGL